MARPTRQRPDFATLAGIVIAFLGIVGGLVLEKGSLHDLSQATALLIVFGGTLGAVLVSTPGGSLLRALRRCRTVFVIAGRADNSTIDTLLGFAMLARRRGIGLLEGQADQVTDPFLRKGLLLAVDGVETKEIRRHMELDLRMEEESVDTDARVFEVAGGYAPTVGIIGAVLGLIQAMKHLNNIGELGPGIAAAFVATLYGVGSANLLLLPVAAKIRLRGRLEAQRRELILEGVLGIAEGLNPHLIRLKLEDHLGPSHQPAIAADSNITKAAASGESR